jgi:hypothetical protein
MSAPLESLVVLPGVFGLCHHCGPELYWSRLPEAIPSERAVALCATVSAAFSAYAGAGRFLREAWFEFPGFAVLVLAFPGPDSSDSRQDFLTFFLSDRSAAPAVIAAAKAIVYC